MEEEAVRGRCAGGHHDGGYVPALAACHAPGGLVLEYGVLGFAGALLRHGDCKVDSVCGDDVYASAWSVAVSEPV